MTSRGRLEVLDVRATPEAVSAQVAASTRSRYPVIDGDLDHVVGVLHIKDLIRASRREAVGLDELIRPLPTVAATATAEQLVERFKRSRTHACLVVDEFGGTLGLVTLDDVIAEVMEEGDESGSAGAIRHDDGSVSLDGEVTLAELRNDHQLAFTHDEVTTLAGLVLARHGTVPSAGTSIELQGHELIAEDVEGHKITRVRVRRLVD